MWWTQTHAISVAVWSKRHFLQTTVFSYLSDSSSVFCLTEPLKDHQVPRLTAPQVSFLIIYMHQWKFITVIIFVRVTPGTSFHTEFSCHEEGAGLRQRVSVFLYIPRLSHFYRPVLYASSNNCMQKWFSIESRWGRKSLNFWRESYDWS